MKNQMKYCLLSAIAIALSSCGQDPLSPTLSAQTTPVAAAAYTQPTSSDIVDIPLTKIYRSFVGGPDHMNTTTPIVGAPYVLEAPTWLVPSFPISNQTHPIYELFGNINEMGDHMTSIITDEGGYAYGWDLGNPYAVGNSAIGLYAMKRYVKYYYTGSSSNIVHYDHMIAANNETPSGYTFDNTQGYGWPAVQAGSASLTTTVSATNTTPVVLTADKAYGGAISSLKVGGVEWVNIGNTPNTDRQFTWLYGRLIQSAIFGKTWCDNPTEAGDETGGKSVNTYATASPVIAFSSTTNKINTKSIGLSFLGYVDPAKYKCGASNNPAIAGWVEIANPTVQVYPIATPLLTGTTFEKTITKTTTPGLYNINVKITAGKTDTGYVCPLVAHLNGGLFTFVGVYYNTGGVWKTYKSALRAYSINGLKDDNISVEADKIKYVYGGTVLPVTQNILVVAYDVLNKRAFGLYQDFAAPSGATRELIIWPFATTSALGGASDEATLQLAPQLFNVGWNAGTSSSYNHYLIIDESPDAIKMKLSTALGI